MTEAGIVLSIHRASLHDGPGIRTTVFLKGCPLRCAWCHNPESQSVRPELAFRAERCGGCGACVAACQHGAQRLDASGRGLDRTACTGCGGCAGTCDAGALELYGRRLDVEECLAPVLADRPFYVRSGGGLTVSGGEPLAQPRFTAALLAGARRHGVHTCLETCGHAGDDAVEAVLPHVDLILFDCKASDDAMHRRLTGVGLDRIEAVRRRILASGIPVRLRCPLVPGLNDDAEHLAAIGRLAARHRLPVEVMPFHPLGIGKSVAIGRPQSGLPGVGADVGQVAEWMRQIRSAGAETVLSG